jgi:glycosyltransferase involved in cell wall biosynthesis
MNTSPTVTILIPCYNSEAYVSDAIESVLAQNYESTEIIVVDDGSTDASKEKVEEYSDQVQLLENEKNRGEAYTCNRGIREASGELVKLLHADDMLCSGVIEKQVSKIKNTESNTAVFGDAKFVISDGTFHHRDVYRPKRDSETWAYHLMKNNPHPSCPLYRKSLLMKHDGFDTSVPMPDYDFHLRLGLAGVKFQYVPGDVSVIRIHDGPDRVQNQNHFEENPKGRLNRIQDRWERVDEAGMLSSRVKRHLAQDAWQGGRRALRDGYDEIAKEYFEYAKNAHPSHVSGASTVYSWCVQAFGPKPAEQLAEWKRKLIGK